jgi:agmatinase
MKALGVDENFLGIDDPKLYEYENAKVVIQSAPYEHTSSYLAGSAKGPAAIIAASQYVEFYDEELDRESIHETGISTLPPIEFGNRVDGDAVNLIEQHTRQLIDDGKFVVSLGAEHTVTLGFVKAHAAVYGDITVLQIDAHSDLRMSYHDNPYSHASVMARVHELGLNIVQVGIRAQCKEEAELIRSSDRIHTIYAHQVRNNPQWMDSAIAALSEKVYITIDADGFDPSIVPCVGTAEPNGLLWNETIEFLRKVINSKTVVGFDVVEVAPQDGTILSEYTLAKLIYKMLGMLSAKG